MYCFCFLLTGNCSKPSKARKRNSSFVLLCKNANLIREIEKYPVIYNPSNKLIDENACTEAWKSVAYALNETGKNVISCDFTYLQYSYCMEN